MEYYNILMYGVEILCISHCLFNRNFLIEVFEEEILIHS